MAIDELRHLLECPHCFDQGTIEGGPCGGSNARSVVAIADFIGLMDDGEGGNG